VYEAARHARPHAPKAFLFATARHLMADRIRRERIVSIRANDRFSVAAGAQNLFDEYPDKDRRSLDPVYGLPGNGNQYIDASPFGYNGGFWYTRVTATF
jgi:DNA-directed RNA polymerase specialized sigma24 family protein